MATGLLAKVALATVAAVGLYLPTVGLPLPLNSCPRTLGLANAAPSPTCASDLRECLHASARTGLYGVRYVTAEDVARCMEAFRACSSGAAREGGNPAAPTSTPSGKRGGLPQRFEMRFHGSGIDLTNDCRISGDTVTCTETQPPTGDMDSWEGQITGSLSGLTVTGTKTARLRGHGAVDSGCIAIYDFSGPVTLVFGTDGNVTQRWGPGQVQMNWSGSCPGSRTDTNPVVDVTGKWSPVQ